MTTTRTQANNLWNSLREHFSNAEETIKEIIATRAWEPLGYETFGDAWREKMAGQRLASEGLRVAVVYALFDEGLDEVGAMRTLGIGSGVSVETASNLHRQHRKGVPPEAASTHVRSHERKVPPASAQFIRVNVGSDLYRHLRDMAYELDSTIEEMVRPYVLEALAGIRLVDA